MKPIALAYLLIDKENNWVQKMNNIEIFEKGSAKPLTVESANQHQSIYKVNVDKNSISKMVRVDNNLELILVTGSKIIIPGFFATTFVQELVLESSDGKYFLAQPDGFNAEGVATKVDYVAIDDWNEFVTDQHSSTTTIPIAAWIAGGALVAGGIAAASGSSGSDNSSSKPPLEPTKDTMAPVIDASVQDSRHVKITSNEAGSVVVTDAQGHTIGSGTISENGELVLNLVRPLQDGENIKVVVKDAAGNTTIKDITVGDVTAPSAEIEVQDSEHITVKTDEPGIKVEIKNENGDIIGSGVSGSDGAVDIVLTIPVKDGERINVIVTDPAGNQSEESFVIPDITAPTVNVMIQDSTHIKVTSNEAGQVVIKDNQGNTIGAGQLNEKGDLIVELNRPLIDGEKLQITVTDVVGNVGTSTVITGDVTAPELDSAVVNANGQVILTFNEALDAGNPPTASDFTVKINGIDRIPDSVQINGKDVSLSFIPPIYQGQTIEVSYKDPTANVDDAKALQDTTGNDVADFSETVNNNGSQVIDPSIDRTAPELDNAVVNANGQVILTFNEALDAGNPPTASDFTVKINGIDRIPDSVQINGKDVSLSFIPPIYQGQTVEVSYKDPTANVDDAKALQDTTGNDVADFSETVNNNGSQVIDPSIDRTAPELDNAVVNANGQVILTFNEALDAGKPTCSKRLHGQNQWN